MLFRSGEDILIAGTTTYYNEANGAANVTALRALLDEWALGVCPRICQGFLETTALSVGCGFFGLSPNLGAHRSPQGAAPAPARRQIFRRLWVRQISCHSADAFSKPRNKNLRMPRADLIMPNTGSIMCLRAA